MELKGGGRKALPEVVVGKGGLTRLTRRERQCLALVAEHNKTREIARRLALSPATVDEHLARAVRKLGASSRAEAARTYLAESGALASTVGQKEELSAGWNRWCSPLVSLSWGGVMFAAGVLGLLTFLMALSQIAGLWPHLASVASLLSALAPAIILILCYFSLVVGREPERLAVGVSLTAWAVTMEVSAGWSPQLTVTAVDAVAAFTMVMIAHGYRRRRLRAAAVLLLVSALTHVAALVGVPVKPVVYLSAIYGLSYGVLGLILWSALDAHDRWELSPPS